MRGMLLASALALAFMGGAAQARPMTVVKGRVSVVSPFGFLMLKDGRAPLTTATITVTTTRNTRYKKSDGSDGSVRDVRPGTGVEVKGAMLSPDMITASQVVIRVVASPR